MEFSFCTGMCAADPTIIIVTGTLHHLKIWLLIACNPLLCLPHRKTEMVEFFLGHEVPDL